MSKITLPNGHVTKITITRATADEKRNLCTLCKRNTDRFTVSFFGDEKTPAGIIPLCDGCHTMTLRLLPEDYEVSPDGIIRPKV